MGVAKFDDGTADNPKMFAAGPVASWLWFCGVLYCRRALTDGYIPKGKVPALISSLSATGAFKQATKLCDVGLWHEEIGGYRVHDYLDWNPTKAAIENYRKRDRARKHERHGIHAESDLESDRNPEPAANACAPHAGAKSESESERFGDLVSEREEIPTGERPVFRKPEPRHVGLINGAEQRRHQGHGWCAPRDGLCVLDFLHREFLGKSRRTEAELKRWYLSVVQAYEGAEIGEDALVFWRNEFAAWVGTVTAKPAETRESRTLAAARRTSTSRGELP